MQGTRKIKKEIQEVQEPTMDVRGDETLPDEEWTMDKRYQWKEEMEALVKNQINALELQDVLKIGKNLNISLTKWPLDYTG